MNLRELTKEQLGEESLIDLANALLDERKAPLAFLDLLKEIQKINGITDKEIQNRLVQFYTDMNVDGRFLLNNDNTWGLREWYKVETIEEETAPTVKSRKRKTKAVLDEDEEELEIDEDDLVFEEDLEEFVDEEELDEDEEDVDFDKDIDEIDVDADVDEVDVDVDVETEIDEDLIDEEDAFIIDEDDDVLEDDEDK